jgi:tripartite-type tricarboxylate transporter receptor subunit TctC
MKPLSWSLLALLAMPPVLGADQNARAESYPDRPVKMIVPYAAGGPGDVLTRIVAQKLSARTGVPFVVENLPGAGGTIGTSAAAKAPADGYTLLMVNQDFVVQPTIKAHVPYDASKTFAPVSLVATAPEMISVHPSVPAKNIDELLALIKADPGKYSYATPGYGTSPHLASERLFRLSHGLDVVHVPFQGGGPAVQSTVAGHTQIIHIIAPAVEPYIKDGTLRPLAVAAKVRSPAFPDVPTLEESGIPNHEVAFWIGGVVPSGTAPKIVDILQRLFTETMDLPEVRQRLATLGFEPSTNSSEEFAAHIQSELRTWRKVVEEARLKID